MISLLLLIFTVTISSIVIRIATIALEITGMPEDQAHFQALSSFSGVGFTTREAEYVVSHPQRRKIIRFLIYTGSAGVITSVATLAGTLVSSPKLASSLLEDTSLSWLPINQTQLILLIVLFPFVVFYALLRNRAVARAVKEIIAVWLLKEKIVQSAEMEELTFSSNGYGVSRLDVTEDSPIAGKRIKETPLAEHGVTILSIERLSESLVYPTGLTEIEVGDSIFCFGPIEAIRTNCMSADLQESQAKKAKDSDLLEVGTVAPDFSLSDQTGKIFHLAEERLKNAVIAFFYPKDKSYFCSQMVKEYSEKIEELKKLGIVVVGINPSSVDCHKEFCELVNSAIPVLSDEKKEVCKAYGTLAFGGLLVDRTVYVISRDGRVVFAERGSPDVVNVIAAARGAGGI